MIRGRSHMFKKLAPAMIGVLLLSAPFVTSAQTVADLQAQVQALLSQIQTLQAQLNTAHQTSTPAGDSGSCITLTRDLWADQTDASTGGEVSKLQRFLALDRTIFPEGKVTGYFGPATELAVQRWQAAHSLVSSGDPDSTGYGYVGRKTRFAMACTGTATSIPVVNPFGIVATSSEYAPAHDIAPLSVSPATGASPLSVQFTFGEASGMQKTGLVYPITFGDGISGTLTYNPSACNGGGCYVATHLYTVPGTFSATVWRGSKSTAATFGNTSSPMQQISSAAVTVTGSAYTGTIPVTSPIAGQSITPGSTVAIQWSDPMATSSTKYYIVLWPSTYPAGSGWPLAGAGFGMQDISGTSFSWTVDTRPTPGTYLIRVCRLGENMCGSSGTFQITAPGDSAMLGTYIFYLSGGQLVYSSGISQSDAYASCKSNAATYATKPVRCTWNGVEIYNNGVTITTQNTNVSTTSTTTTTTTAATTTTSVKTVGTLSASLDASSPAYQIAAGGSTGVMLGAFKFHASGEDISLQKVRIFLGSGALPADVKQLTLWNGTTLVGTGYFTGTQYGTVVTLAQPVSIAKDTDKILTVKADLAGIGIGQSGKSGDIVQVGMQFGFGDFYGIGATSGATIQAIGSNASTAGVRMFKSYPTISLLQLPMTTLVQGQSPLLRFSVTANVAGNVGLAYITPTIVANNVKFSSVSAYAFTDAAYSMPVTTVSPNGMVSNVNPSTGLTGSFSIPITNGATPIEVPAGQTYYFQIMGNVSSISGNGAVTVTLPGDGTYTDIGTYNGNVSRFSSHNFIWSPNDLTMSQFTDADWTNGFGLPGFSLGGITQTLTGSGSSVSAATLTPTPASGTAPLSTTFFSNMGGAGYVVDLGDGVFSGIYASGNGYATPAHSYSASGTYTAKLLYFNPATNVDCRYTTCQTLATAQVTVTQAPATTGLLSVSVDASSPAFQTVKAGTTGVTLGAFKFHASGENVVLKKMSLTLPSGKAGDLSQVYFYDNMGTLLGTAMFPGIPSATSYFFSTPVVQRDSDAVIVVKADISPSATAGDVVKIQVDDPTQGVGATTGSTIRATASVPVQSAGVQIPQLDIPPTCTISASPSSAFNGSSVIVSWKGSTSTLYATFVPDLSGKANINVPSDKLPPSGSYPFIMNVLGTPTVTVQVVSATGQSGQCTVTIPVSQLGGSTATSTPTTVTTGTTSTSTIAVDPRVTGLANAFTALQLALIRILGVVTQ